jgi:hypothetical protein
MCDVRHHTVRQHLPDGVRRKTGGMGVSFGEVSGGGSCGRRPSGMGMVGSPFFVSEVVRCGREGMV